MTAVFRREVGSYFKGVLGYLLAAFLLVLQVSTAWLTT